MDYDAYLKNIYTLISNDLLKFKKEINYLHSLEEFERKEISFKSQKQTTVICPYVLETGVELLVKDLPLNFLRAYQVRVGETTKLLKTTYLNSTTQVIFEEKYLEEIKEFVSTDNIKEIDAKNLKNLRTITKYEEVPLITDIKRYAKKYLNQNLYTITLDKESSSISHFLPNNYYRDFNQAKELKLPLTNHIEKGFLKDTDINCYDLKQLISYLKPLKQSKEKIYTPLTKNKSLITLPDIREHLYLQIKGYVYDTIQDIKKTITNFDKKIQIQELNSLKEIKISTKKSTSLLPLFYKKKFLEIKNCNEFKKISGVEFKLNKRFLSNLYMQTQEGKKIEFKEFYLKEEFKFLTQEIPKTNRIEFTTNLELILKTQVFEQSPFPKELKNTNNLNSKQREELKKITSKLATQLILLSVNKNSNPNTKHKNTSTISNYLFYNAEYLKENCIDKEDKTKFKLLKKTINKVRKIVLQFELSQEELLGVYQLLLTILQIEKELIEKTSEYIQLQLEEFFGKQKKISHYLPNVIQKENNLLEDILLLKKIQQGKILIKKDHPLLNKELPKKITKADPHNITFFQKPDTLKLKELFPNNYSRISKDICSQKNTSYLGKREIQLPKESIHLTPKLQNYFIKLNNEYFTLFLPSN